MQSRNPLFPQADDAPEDDGVLYVHHKPKPAPASTTPTPASTPTAPTPEPVPATQPLAATNSDNGTNAALNIIRDKVARVYAEEPNAAEEERKAAAAQSPSKHQRFMRDLQASGKTLVEVQTAWHQYYTQLPDAEKHQVWQEFYAANDRAKDQQRAATAPAPQPYQPMRMPAASLSTAFSRPQPIALPALPNTLTKLPRLFSLPKRPASHPTTPAVPEAVASDSRTPAELRSTIVRTVTANGRLKLRHHLQSLSFGLAIGFITLVIALFGLFNEVIIAPFIQPGRLAGATPIIIDASSVATTTQPEVIIPKINLEIPVDYTETSNDDQTIQNALENGVVHYPSTVMPGQNGNAAFFGHSSNNIFNPGKYKFAFVLLHELVPGDTFYLTYNGKAYVYKVFQKLVVDPDDVSVLDNVAGHQATATLITCDPPGTVLHRLIVIGDQISPDPATNGVGDNTAATSNVGSQLPDNGPSLLQRIWDSVF